MKQTIINKDSKNYFIQLKDVEYDRGGGFKPSGINTEDPMVIHVALKEVERMIEQIHNMRYELEEAIIITKHFKVVYKIKDHINDIHGEIKVISQHLQLTRGKTE